MRVVADTSVWVSLFRNEHLPMLQKFRELLAQGLVLVGDVVLLELLIGARSEAEARRIEALLKRLEIVEMLNTELAITAAANYRVLRGHGRTVRKSNDLLIGTYCIEHGLPLFHRDRDFNAMREFLGLQIYTA